MIVYDYFAFCDGRMSRGKGGLLGLRDFTAWILMLAVQIRLVSAMALVWAPRLFELGGPWTVGAISALPLIALNAIASNNVARYERNVATFCELQRPRRRLADCVVAVCSVAALIAPLFSRSLVTGRPWWI
jgi:hypothetical protein